MLKIEGDLRAKKSTKEARTGADIKKNPREIGNFSHAALA